MTGLLLAASFFAGIHLVAATPIRRAIVGALGERVYMVLFSVASLGGFVWFVRAYQVAFASGNLLLWDLGPGVRHAAGPVMLVASFFVVVGLLTPLPVGTMQDQPLEPTGIQRITRHPILCGAILWAVFHLVANGDLASIVLFGTFLLTFISAMSSIDRRRRGSHGEAWQRFASATSRLPFIAILAGRTRFVARELGWWKILLALVAFGAVVSIHPWLFGAYPLPGMAD